MKKKIIYSFILFNILALFYTSQTLSISYKEIEFINSDTLYSLFINKIFDLFGQSDMVLRLIPFTLYLLSIYIFYQISKYYNKNQFDIILSLAIFVTLPAVVSAGLILNQATLTIFLTLLFIYIFHKKELYSYLFLPIYLYIDNSFVILIFAILLFNHFEVKTKNSKYVKIYLTTLLLIGYYLYSFSHFGKPLGHFIDIFLIYSAIFSPLLFIYIFYLLYRGLFGESKRSLLWYIASTSFFISIIFSFRQKIYIEDFAPFVLIFTPIVISSFMFSLRVRLPIYRKSLKVVFYTTLFTLCLSTLFIYFNQVAYIFIEKDFNKHFAYKNHIISELAVELKSKKIDNIALIDIKNGDKLEKRLNFYGISSGYRYKISNKITQKSDLIIDIKYFNKIVATFYVSKINI